MEHNLGQIDLIRWQGRRNRRIKSGLSPWTVFIVACAVAGAASMAAEAMGLISLSGLGAAVPPGLILIAVSAQIAAFVRATIIWLIS